MLDKFIEFLSDPEAWDLYITGPAGTGKTTALGELANHCLQANIEFVVCAFTHKACGILAEKLPAGTPIRTLHSVLRKRPSINDRATKAKHVEVSRQHDKPEKYQLMLVDEFSMVGEQDYMDIVAMQDPEYEADVAMKVVYIGDLNQLPPVGDMQTITPEDPWWIKLTTIHRQKDGNQLLGTLGDLVDMLQGGKPKALESNKNFIRGVDIVEKYKLYNDHLDADPVLLAYTNMRVESLNAQIAGKDTPDHTDVLFSPTTRMHYIMDHFIETSKVESIVTAFGGEELLFNTKYKTLEHLITMQNVQFIQLHTEAEGEFVTHACVFGHYQYKLALDELKFAAANSNKEIEHIHKTSAKMWAGANPHSKLTRARSKAWRDYLTFKDCVICLDFPYAMTVHKSQGSTYDTVFIDTDDLYKCAERNFELYLRLMYVAISRASNIVYTN